MSWKVRFFQSSRGEYPVKSFIEEQNEALYAKAIHYIGLLSGNGPYLKPPYMKKLQNKLWELRISGTVAIRIFYTMVNNEYYLLHAFKKKTQQTPAKEIKTALDRMAKII